MYFKQSQLRLSGVLIAFIVLAFASSVRAQRPETSETFVYGVNATTPGEVYANLSPPQVEELYILANRVTMLSPRRTQLFFWPLSQRYRANWTELNEPVDGVLEIVAPDQVVSTVSLTIYTVHYIVAGSTIGELYLSDEAEAAERRLQTAQLNHNQAITIYRQERLQWLGEARQAIRAGELPFLKAEPRRPASFTTLSVGLQQGFPLLLEAGEYQVRMRGVDGDIISGSQRTIHVFTLEQTSLGYEVIPEQRWQMPEQVNDARDAIVAEPGSVIYLRPRLVHKYPALALERLRDPQFGGEVEGRWRWVPDFSQIDLPHDVLEVWRGGEVVERIIYTPYSVRFAFDRDLGYEILPYDAATPALTPEVDFAGFRIQLPSGSDSFTIRLGPDYELPYAGAERRVWVLPADLSLFLIPVVLLVVVLALLAWAISTKKSVATLVRDQ